jgi:hypothetical protein
LRPQPVHAAVQRIGKFAHAALVGVRAIEVLRGEQRAGNRKRRVDGRHLLSHVRRPLSSAFSRDIHPRSTPTG